MALGDTSALPAPASPRSACAPVILRGLPFLALIQRLAPLALPEAGPADSRISCQSPMASHAGKALPSLQAPLKGHLLSKSFSTPSSLMSPLFPEHPENVTGTSLGGQVLGLIHTMVGWVCVRFLEGAPLSYLSVEARELE